MSRRILVYFQPLLDYLHIPSAIRHTLIRKLGHAAEYFLLGAIWAVLLLRGKPRPRFPRLFAASSLCLLTALVDETIQLFSPGRGGMLPDVWLDFAGAWAGILAAAAAHRLFRRIRPV